MKRPLIALTAQNLDPDMRKAAAEFSDKPFLMLNDDVPTDNIGVYNPTKP